MTVMDRSSQSAPCSGLAEEEEFHGLRMRGEQQPGGSQKCCTLWGGGWEFQFRSLQKRERIATVRTHL